MMKDLKTDRYANTNVNNNSHKTDHVRDSSAPSAMINTNSSVDNDGPTRPGGSSLSPGGSAHGRPRLVSDGQD